MPAPVAEERVLQNVAASATVTLRDQNGEPAATVGTVTVDVARADGTVVTTALPTTQDTPALTGVYHVALTATQTALLDFLALSWKDGGTVRATTHVEVVGGYYFDVATASATEPELADRQRYTASSILAFRRPVEHEAERVARCAFVPRYRRIVIDRCDDQVLRLPDPLIRTIREISPVLGSTYTSDQLVSLNSGQVGTVNRYAGVVDLGYAFTAGQITVAYEHGYDRPPDPVRNMAIRRLRYHLNLAKSPTADRQARYVIDPDTGRTMQFSTAGTHRTGDDEVDAVYRDHGVRPILVA